MFHNFFPGFEHGGGHHHHRRRQRTRAQKKNVDTEAYYKFLGVSKNATQKELKKAYRKKAMRMHPDRGGDPDKFKHLNKVYEVLTNEEKKSLYDKGGEEAVEKGDLGGGDPFDPFGFGGGGGRSKKKKGPDVMAKIGVTLEDLYRGATKPLRFMKHFLCDECNGSGGEGVKPCGICDGRGVRMQMRQLGPGMIQQLQTECHTCQGEGEIIPKGSRCRYCKGRKVLQKMTELKVHINKGMKHGTKIKFREEADQSPNTIPGDLIVKLQMEEHPRFHREGAHLFYQKKITLLEALTGFEFTIETLEQRTLIVKSEPDVLYSSGCVRAVRDEGMPQETNPSVRGNLYIIISVIFPTKIDDQSIRLLKKVFPKKKSSIKNRKNLEEVYLKPVNMDQERKKWKEENQGKCQYDSDDDWENSNRGHTTQCQTQ